MNSNTAPAGGSKASSSNIRHSERQNPRRAPKSRQGCQRCKTKRLKCDEKKPQCYQCVKRRVDCCYASKQLVWSTKHEKMLVANVEQHVPPTLVPNAVAEAASASMGQLLQIAASPVNSVEDMSINVSHIESPNDGECASTIIKGGIDQRKGATVFTDSLSAIRHQLNNSTVPEFLVHLPTMLVDYYFNYICVIFSSFDGMLNPFRATVGKLWDGSAPIYYAIQSMAAAYLASHFPRMSTVGVQMQREAFKCLYQSPKVVIDSPDNIDKALLTVLLVGQTTAWHNPRDLGLVHLKTAQRLYNRRLEYQKGDTSSKTLRQNEFFEQCIIYWDMLAAFVEDAENIELQDEKPDENPSTVAPEAHQIFPHPWTGVAPKLQSLFSKVGRLIRAYRKDSSVRLSIYDFDNTFFEFNPEALLSPWITKAQVLEEQLLSFNLPSETVLVDAGDENTPVRQYILLAEAYRCAGLLELYRVFPTIYLNRQPNTQAILSLPALHSADEFLVSLAIHIISLLEKLPQTSGTRCLQPVVLIVAASELRFSPASNSTFPLDGPFAMFPGIPGLENDLTSNSTTLFNGITKFEVDVAAARRFVTARFQDFQVSLPAKPMTKAMTLIQETWARADLGQEVFWMDVMSEMGLESIYG